MGSKATKQRRSLSEDADPSHLLPAQREKSRFTNEASRNTPKCCPFLSCFHAATTKTCSVHEDSNYVEERRQRRRKQRVTILIVGAESVGKSQLASVLESGVVGGAPLASGDLCSINMHHTRREISRLKRGTDGELRKSRKKQQFDIYVWDTPGSGASRAHALTYAHSVDVVYVVYNPSVAGSGLAASRQWAQDILAIQRQRARTQDTTKSATRPRLHKSFDLSRLDGGPEAEPDQSDRMTRVDQWSSPIIVFVRNDAARYSHPNFIPTPATDEDRQVLDAAKCLKTKRIISISLLPGVRALEKYVDEIKERKAKTLHQVNQLLQLTCQAVTLQKPYADAKGSG